MDIILKKIDKKLSAMQNIQDIIEFLAPIEVKFTDGKKPYPTLKELFDKWILEHDNLNAEKQTLIEQLKTESLDSEKILIKEKIKSLQDEIVRLALLIQQYTLFNEKYKPTKSKPKRVIPEGITFQITITHKQCDD